MKEKDSHVCSQINRGWSDLNTSIISNSRVTLTCAYEAIIYSRLASLMQFKLGTNET